MRAVTAPMSGTEVELRKPDRKLLIAIMEQEAKEEEFIKSKHKLQKEIDEIKDKNRRLEREEEAKNTYLE